MVKVLDSSEHSKRDYTCTCEIVTRRFVCSENGVDSVMISIRNIITTKRERENSNENRFLRDQLE